MTLEELMTPDRIKETQTGHVYADDDERWFIEFTDGTREYWDPTVHCADRSITPSGHFRRRSEGVAMSTEREAEAWALLERALELISRIPRQKPVPDANVLVKWGQLDFDIRAWLAAEESK